EISEQLKKSLIYKEDKYFYLHPGFNPVSIARAGFNNLVSGKITAGASTITMQVVRLLEPRKRSYLSKFIELFRAFQLEFHYSKDEILQLYLNLVPYGGNIEGVKSAALLYMERNPEALSLSQVVTLTLIPNRPGYFTPGKENDRIKAERDKWLLRMKSDHLFPDTEIESAFAEPLNLSRKSPPRLAPHFSQRMHSLFPDSANLKTGLHLETQQKTEALLKNHVRRLSMSGIDQAAVMIIENRTGKVVAYAGSADFNNSEVSGQVDGIRAVRSPGSTLKPFAYALASDRGLVTPKSILLDVPTDFNGYTPENFDEEFNGPVTMEDALAQSLNLPAVTLTEALSPRIFIELLVSSGFRQIKADSYKLGLSVVLGGCGVRLEELVAAYSIFTRQGRYLPLKWIKSDTTSQTIPIISPESAYMTGKILTLLTRPDFPQNYQSGIHLPKIAWKTGTSYGRRDGWSIGFNHRFTIGVWVGNFSGQGVPELTGADMATPLLFDVFNSVDYNSTNEWFPRPKELEFRLVCEESGLPPGPDCTNQIMDDFLPSVSSNRICSHLKKVKTNETGTVSYCTRCDPGNGTKWMVFPDLQPELISWNEKNGIRFEKIPPHNPACTRIFTEKGPLIASPSNQTDYFVEKGEKQKIQLLAHAESDVAQLFWYVNDRLTATTKPGTAAWIDALPGSYNIQCSDDKGRSSSIRFRISYQ
ncbi:MAG: penicillin-binding protein 1C, partial [Bacteroidetes bacterium]|nr:penicillin-binding protein 1C [Bacteroidota bacterium]